MARHSRASDRLQAIDPVSIPCWIGVVAMLWLSRDMAGAWLNPGTALHPIDIAAVFFAAGCVAFSGRGFLKLGAWAAIGQHIFITAPIVLAVGMFSPALGITIAAVLHVIAARIGRYLAKALAGLPPGTCHVCEYDLTGVDAEVCPECGSTIASGAVDDVTPMPARLAGGTTT